jgi:hypothetical protein
MDHLTPLQLLLGDLRTALAQVPTTSANHEPLSKAVETLALGTTALRSPSLVSGIAARDLLRTVAGHIRRANTFTSDVTENLALESARRATSLTLFDVDYAPGPENTSDSQLTQDTSGTEGRPNATPN